MFILIELYIFIVAPGLKWWLQHYKEKFNGPWDIAHVEEQNIPKHPSTSFMEEK